MITLCIQLVRHLGLRWVCFRLVYALQLRLGVLQRRTPALPWHDLPLSGWLSEPALAEPSAYAAHRRRACAPRFFASIPPDTNTSYFAAWDAGVTSEQLAISQSEAIISGKLNYFETHPRQVGFPPEWHTDPFSITRWPDEILTRHWSRIGDFGQGDIKIIWEPSRFSFAYTLARAYARVPKPEGEQFASGFWQAFEDWMAHNPPNSGPNWRCGQETTFRVMAWCFAMYVFADATASTPTRIAQLAQAIAVSGERIAANLHYALSQNNNHGISEAIGLWTIGTLFPEFRHAEQWRMIGLKWLETQAQTLIYDDGSFSQHSTNYHRVMLHDFAWALALDDCNNRELSATMRERLCKAVDWLHALIELENGRVPRYGANDGALVLPLTNCSPDDFRPVIQSLNVLLRGKAILSPGAWDEERFWLGRFNPELYVHSPVSLPQLHGGEGGYYVFRGNESKIFTRCPLSFRHRPSHADVLHIDLWWRGINVLQDAGTHSYNPSPHATVCAELEHTRHHNTVMVDNQAQMTRMGRFLWLPWVHGRVVQSEFDVNDRLIVWSAEHDGYLRFTSPAHHRRKIELERHSDKDVWQVTDDLASATEHMYSLHWLLAEMTHDFIIFNPNRAELNLYTVHGLFRIVIQSSVPATFTIQRAQSDGLSGWYAPHYNKLEPAMTLQATVHSPKAQFVTLLTPVN
jgi:asparagine synthase (glutamine-hydrolysing)